MPFVIDNAHRCFKEAFQFYMYAVSGAAIRNPKLLADDVLVISAGTPSCVQLENVGAFLQFLKTGRGRPRELTFNTVLASVSATPHKVRRPADRRAFPTLCTYLLGYAWERHAKRIAGRLPKRTHVPKCISCAALQNPKEYDDLPKWPVDIQFYRHVRNACFHRGTFTIGHGQIEAPNFPRWHGFEIRDRKINGTRVLNDGFLDVTHVLRLLHDMGHAIDRILPRRPKKN